jgi:hypothetical protein
LGNLAENRRFDDDPTPMAKITAEGLARGNFGADPLGIKASAENAP